MRSEKATRNIPKEGTAESKTWRAPVPRRRAGRWKLCLVGTRSCPTLGSLLGSRLRGRDCLTTLLGRWFVAVRNQLEGRRLRRPLEFGQFPSRIRQSDGRGRPSHIVARASPPAERASLETPSSLSREHNPLLGLANLREAQAPPPGVWLSLRLGDGVEDGAMKIWLWFFGVVVEASLRAEVGKRLGSNRSAPKFVA